MAGVIKVETFDVDVTATASQTHTLTTDVGSLNNAFVRRTTSIDKQSGPVGNTGNANANIACGAAFLSGTNQISFRQDTTTSQKIIGEVWRYTGAASGPDEFIVRGRYAITLNGTTTGSIATSGIGNVDKCIPFWTGATQTAASVNDYDASTVSVYIDASGNIQCERGSSTGTFVVYVTVVEFTGSNWSVGHVRSASHDGANETNITIRTNSLATTGTFDVGSWNSAAIIEASLEGDTSETGLSDNLGCWTPGGNTTQASFFNDQDTGTQNDGISYAHILAHPTLAVNRASDIDYSEGNNTYTSVPWPAGASIVSPVDELSLEWFSDTSGTGTAHARGRLSSQILTSSTANAWVHRSGNNVRIEYGVVDLSNITGIIPLSITDVDGDNIVSNIQTGVVISGSEFGATQGSGTVILAENSDSSGTTISQTVTNWTDTSVTVNISAGALADTNCFLVLTNDSAEVGVKAITVGIPPISYTEAVQDLSPDHYWTWDNTYADIGEEGPNNAVVSGGSPTFTANPLTRDKTQAWTITAQGQGATPPNSNFINGQTETTRSMGGWIRFTEIQDSFTCFYEEGGSVNNITFLMGIGGILIAQLADTSDDNVHAYSDFKLQPNRTYHILFRFDYNSTDRFELLVDGVLQTVTFGNPLTATDLDAHTGDIAFGGTYDTLEVFGTDIQFPGVTTCYYQDWASWTTYLTDAQVRETLFEQGVRGDIVISSNTEANMQTAFDVYADTIQPNSDCNFIVQACTDGDFTLNADNIVLSESSSIHIQYLGLDTLTLVNLNGSNFSKVSELNGGTVTIVTPASLTISGLQANTEVRVFEAGATTEVAGIESTSGDWITSLQTSLVDISILNLSFRNIKLKNVDTSSDAFIPVVQQIDRQYLNS